jgi:hypothetical protein
VRERWRGAEEREDEWWRGGFVLSVVVVDIDVDVDVDAKSCDVSDGSSSEEEWGVKVLLENRARSSFICLRRSSLCLMDSSGTSRAAKRGSPGQRWQRDRIQNWLLKNTNPACPCSHVFSVAWHQKSGKNSRRRRKEKTKKKEKTNLVLINPLSRIKQLDGVSKRIYLW